jgi:hypothetical protein
MRAMPRKKIHLREVAGFLAELEEAGARDVQLASVDARGRVEIRWEPSAEEEARVAAIERAGRTEILLSLVVALVVAAVLVVTLVRR